MHPAVEGVGVLGEQNAEKAVLVVAGLAGRRAVTCRDGGRRCALRAGRAEREGAYLRRVAQLVLDTALVLHLQLGVGQGHAVQRQAHVELAEEHVNVAVDLVGLGLAGGQFQVVEIVQQVAVGVAQGEVEAVAVEVDPVEHAEADQQLLAVPVRIGHHLDRFVHIGQAVLAAAERFIAAAQRQRRSRCGQDQPCCQHQQPQCRSAKKACHAFLPISPCLDTPGARRFRQPGGAVLRQR